MSVKIGILSDGSAIHFDHRNLFSNLASLNTAIRTTALTELELSALKAYTEIIHEGNRELVEIFCPWQNKSKRTFPFLSQYKTMNNEVYRQASSYVRGHSPSWDRNNRTHRLYQANSILILLGDKFNEPLDALAVHYDEHTHNQLYMKPIIQLAEYYKIPVLRLQDNGDIQTLYEIHPELIIYSE